MKKIKEKENNLCKKTLKLENLLCKLNIISKSICFLGKCMWNHCISGGMTVAICPERGQIQLV